MSVEETTERRSKLQTAILEQLHDPLRLRLILTAVVLVVGYQAVYAPMRERIVATNRKHEDMRNQLALAREVEQLRSQFHDVQKRLPQQTDAKEWLQYMLKNTQKFNLKLKSLRCDPPRDLGPYKAVVFQMEVTGTLADLDRLLSWLELNQRFFRVDTLNISSTSDKGNPSLKMNLTILGMMG